MKSFFLKNQMSINTITQKDYVFLNEMIISVIRIIEFPNSLSALYRCYKIVLDDGYISQEYRK